MGAAVIVSNCDTQIALESKLKEGHRREDVVSAAGNDARFDDSSLSGVCFIASFKINDTQKIIYTNWVD